MLPLPASQAGECEPPGPPREVSIRHVIDGDTVILSDGDHARLVGINTPEIGRDGPDEPLARPARRALVGLVETAADQLVAHAAHDRRDRHGRRLVHLAGRDGRNLQAALLEKGLGIAIYMAPNLALADCYRQAELTARKHGKGLWDRPETVTSAERISADARGFHAVTGRIRSSRRFDSGLRLRFHDAFHVWLPASALQRFGNDPARLAGHRVFVRGWAYGFRDKTALRVDHPYALIDCGNAATRCPHP